MKLTRRTVLYIFFSVLFLAVAINFFRMMGQQAVVLTWAEGDEVHLDVADSPEERMVGLLFLEQLPRNRGMVFLFEDGEPMRLWTRHYRFAVDLVWLGPDFEVVGIQPDVPPCEKDPCPTYSPESPDARYALALAAGEVARRGLQEGDQVMLSREGG